MMSITISHNRQISLVLKIHRVLHIRNNQTIIFIFTHKRRWDWHWLPDWWFRLIKHFNKSGVGIFGRIPQDLILKHNQVIIMQIIRRFVSTAPPPWRYRGDTCGSMVWNHQLPKGPWFRQQNTINLFKFHILGNHNNDDDWLLSPAERLTPPSSYPARSLAAHVLLQFDRRPPNWDAPPVLFFVARFNRSSRVHSIFLPLQFSWLSL